LIESRPSHFPGRLLAKSLDIFHLAEQLKLCHAVYDFRITVIRKLIRDLAIAVGELSFVRSFVHSFIHSVLASIRSHFQPPWPKTGSLRPHHSAD